MERAQTAVTRRRPAGPRTPGTAPPWRGEGAVLAAVAVGGGAGAAGRYGLTLLWPDAGAGIPWSMVTVNAVGCALIGVLMVVLGERPHAPRLLRPFLGTGLLGGFTTFSAYAWAFEELTAAGRDAAAFGSLILTPVLSLAAAWLGWTVTHRTLLRRRRPLPSAAPSGEVSRP
ncbi:CrcB family protein [Streptomyces sp. YIM 98790]|uniref:fluoride efflux transporter FluC n=1 Tax=Streptomyces sp. YIM 98790 TaxID=2689077 RepID=UPI00140A3CFF|nr:CrcB family protein [Streptomyces sp. YIM 98790]